MQNPSLKILVVEDNARFRDLLCEMLSILGHAAIAAGSAEDCLELMRSQHIDVLLADINLPGMSGIELAGIAVKAIPGIRIIFASGYGYLVADKTDFDFILLPKPYGLSQLKEALEQISTRQPEASGSQQDSSK
ncbi:response regulator [Noviherbaspirillum massiliense]|uniref:response regulator n=1 Tax=Noviherbaspirillum massiliense TaxID=1465823 RepID=UPI00030F5544|nr:response regulator [Noviherbaspirillum massiliense]